MGPTSYPIKTPKMKTPKWRLLQNSAQNCHQRPLKLGRGGGKSTGNPIVFLLSQQSTTSKKQNKIQSPKQTDYQSKKHCRIKKKKKIDAKNASPKFKTAEWPLLLDKLHTTNLQESTKFSLNYSTALQTTQSIWILWTGHTASRKSGGVQFPVKRCGHATSFAWWRDMARKAVHWPGAVA